MEKVIVSALMAIPKFTQSRWLRQLLRCSTLVAKFALTFLVLSLGGERPKASESQVQAAYLYNFGQFVRWPANAAAARSNSFEICVFGQDPFGPTLNTTVLGGSIGGKGVVAKHIGDAREGVSCQILFISSSEYSQLSDILDALNKAAVLTVSDMPRFAERGGMIQFVLEGKRVRFIVALTATQSAGLVLSSELLKVAAAVK